jgi:CRISPR type I-E-associated protein CasB/Cse2
MSGDRIEFGGLLGWHRSLTGKAPRRAEGKVEEAEADTDPRRRELAELRRARTPADVMLCPAFAELVAACMPEARSESGRLVGISHWTLEALARTAFLLADVERCILGRGFAAAMSAQRNNGPAVSAVRANVLFRSPDEDAACRVIASMLPILVGGFDPADLYRAMRNWEDTRRRWASAYHLEVHRQKRPVTQNQPV